MSLFHRKCVNILHFSRQTIVICIKVVKIIILWALKFRLKSESLANSDSSMHKTILFSEGILHGEHKNTFDGWLKSSVLVMLGNEHELQQVCIFPLKNTVGKMQSKPKYICLISYKACYCCIHHSSHLISYFCILIILYHYIFVALRHF